MTLTAWAVTTGESGMRTQARGLAVAVADQVVEKILPAGIGWPWRAPLLSPPWPDLIVSCGRRSAKAARAAKRASGGRILAVHVQDPRFAADAFDLVVAMEHDAIQSGEKVIKVSTALHDVTPAALDAAATVWRGRLAPLGRPLAGVIVGGDLRGRAFAGADCDRLVARLERLRAGSGAALAITPSRRTSAETLARIKTAFAGEERIFVWDRSGDNPYLGILALADRLIVTSDSVSMISEALSASHPVEVFDLGFSRHVGFIQTLVDRGLVRRFEGEPSFPLATGPINVTAEVAVVVRNLLQRRTGESG